MFSGYSREKNGAGFTLVELLIVIGILAVLSTTAVVVLNPAQLIAQGRDGKRVSDINIVNKAVSVYESQGGASFGTAQRVYLSLPDASATCASYTSLPALPSPWQYVCATAANYRKTNGTGWIPIDFTTIPGISFASLPVDPVNTESMNQYYTYIGGSWSLTSVMESNKYLKNNSISDGGLDPTRFETGSDKQLWTTASGLVGYWSLDDASGTSARDSSGNNNTGTFSGSGTVWTAGKSGSALDFNGSGSLMINNPLNQSALSEVWSVVAWVKLLSSSPNATQYMVSGMNNGNALNWSTNNKMLLYLNGGANDYYMYGTRSLRDSSWHHVAFVFRNSDGLRRIYMDGTDDSSSGPNNTSTPSGLSASFNIGSSVIGSIDDVRIYNRTLSASEISAMYNAAR